MDPHRRRGIRIGISSPSMPCRTSSSCRAGRAPTRPTPSTTSSARADRASTGRSPRSCSSRRAPRSTRPASKEQVGDRVREDREQHPRRPLRRLRHAPATARSSPRTAVPRSPSCGTRRATWSSSRPRRPRTRPRRPPRASPSTAPRSGSPATTRSPWATARSPSGPSVLVETLIGGLGALIVLAFVFGSLMAFVPLLMAAIAIPTTFLVLWPLARGDRGVGRRAVPDLADRAGRRDRLLAAHRDALARGGRRRPRPLRGGRRDDGARRQGGHLQRHRRGHRPAGDGRAAGAVPAQHRLRRHADPADQRPRGDHAAAGGAGDGRAAARPDRRQPPHGERGSGLGARGAASWSATATSSAAWRW